MEHQLTSPEVTYAPHHNEGTGRIWKTFWVLTVLTIIELALGYFLYVKGHDWSAGGAGLATKIVIGILTLAKAYYIVSVFMHLGDEIRNFIMTIIVPLCLFIWFVIAFLWDGDSWKNMRKDNTGGVKTKTEQAAAPAHAGGH
jgi:cytochrome c oxidase subunit IV